MTIEDMKEDMKEALVQYYEAAGFSDFNTKLENMTEAEITKLYQEIHK